MREAGAAARAARRTLARFGRARGVALAVAWLSLVATAAIADAQVQLPEVDRATRDPIVEALAAGAFLPYAHNAALSVYRAAFSLDAGYDGVRQGSEARLRAELVLLGKRERRWSNANLSLFGGAGYGLAERPKNPPAYGYGGLKFQPLSEAVHGIDGAASLGYTSRGFNLLPAIVGEFVLSKRIGIFTTLFSAGYGHATRANERFASLGAAALLRLLAPLFAGIDLKLSTDLKHDRDEPAYEPQLEALATSVVSFANSFVTLTAHAGLRAVRYHVQSDLLVGPELGFAAATAL